MRPIRGFAFLAVLLLLGCGDGSVRDLPTDESGPAVSAQPAERHDPAAVQLEQDRALSLHASLLADLSGQCGVAAVSREVGSEPSESSLWLVHAGQFTRRQAAYRWSVIEAGHEPLEVVGLFDFAGTTVGSGGLKLAHLSVTPAPGGQPTPWWSLLSSSAASELGHGGVREWQEYAGELAKH